MTNPLRTSFRVRLTFLALLASVPAMLAAYAGVSHVAAELLRADARRDVAVAADQLSRNVRQWDRTMVLALEALRNDPDVIGMDPRRQGPAVERMARAYDWVGVMHTTDLRGVNVVRSDGRAAVDHSDADWFKAARGGAAVVREARMTKSTHVPAVTFASPIRGGGGAVVGVAVLTTPLARLAEVIGTVRIDGRGFGCVLDGQGRVLAHPDGRFMASLQTAGDYAAVIDLVRAGRSASTRFVDAAGDGWLAHTVVLPNGWGVVGMQKEAELARRARDFLWTALGAAGVSLLAILLLMWLAAGRLMRPIGELTGAAAAVAAGRWEHRVSERREDELGSLARSFNAMVERLRREFEGVEERVEERTQRIREQNQALVELARQGGGAGDDLQDALRRITESASRTMGVARASVWIIDDARSRMWCVDLYDLAVGRHTCGAELSAADYPRYFRALDEDRTITAHDAHTDERTAEFSEKYLTAFGIGAMLDAPIRVGGRAVGVVCHEHVGGRREWTAEEGHFADCLANLVATAIESSERRRAEAALRESEERYRLVARATNDVIWDWVMPGDALYWNDSLRRVFGHDPAARDLDMKWWAAHVHPDDRDRVIADMHALVEGGGEQWTAEYRFRRADGTYATVLDRGLVARDAGGRPVRMIGSLLDMTERKRAEALEREQAAMRQAVASMEHVLGVVGHELRTPLAGLRAMSEFLLTDGADEAAEYDMFLRGIHDEVVRMSGTVHNLLEAARLNSGRARWNWSTFKLAEVCEEAVGSLRPLVDAGNVSLTLGVEPPDLTMRGDADGVRRLVMNLLSNAHKHTAAGSIGVSVEAVDNAAGRAAVRVVVRDTGSGIPSHLRARLGEAFALNSGVVGSAYVTGTGLGVAICKGIAEAHGGRIEIESEPGRGTAVTVTLLADLPGPATGPADEGDGGTAVAVAASEGVAA